MQLGVAAGCGTVYELSPPAKKGDPWMETILYSFANTTDGYFPWGDLTFDAKGNLYVATRFGGGKGTNCDPEFNQYCGAVFELSPPRQKGGAWTEKLLHAFAGVTNGQQPGDGAAPNGGLVLDTQGAIYGTTYYGGNNQKGTCEGGSWGTGCGIVFKLVPPKKKGGIWTEKMLHLFDGTDGDLPTAGVIVDGKGNLYGTTYGGPIHGHGLVFELEKPSGKRLSWKETVIYAFKDGNDGGYPDAGLLFDASGHLYGTASAAGAGRGGTVFRITPLRNGNWDFIVLHDFTGNPDGAYPDATLVFDNAGNLYGPTLWAGDGQSCGSYGCGTVFEVSP
jgi:hypothetical protein